MKIETSGSYINLNGMQLDSSGRFRVAITSVKPDVLEEYEEVHGFILDTRWPSPNGLGAEQSSFTWKIPLEVFRNALRKSALQADLMKKVSETRGSVLSEEIRKAATQQDLDLNAPTNAFLLADRLPSGGWQIIPASNLQSILSVAARMPTQIERYVASANPQHGLQRIEGGNLVPAF